MFLLQERRRMAEFNQDLRFLLRELEITEWESRTLSGDVEVSNPNHLSPKSEERINYHNMICKYEVGKSEGFIVRESTGCCICLQSFEESDECRVLNKCNHVYHNNCIDSWLVRNHRCPLCRSLVQGLEFRV
ncbi:hypothetical protein UlMin_044931 [Ulmus minor]